MLSNSISTVCPVGFKLLEMNVFILIYHCRHKAKGRWPIAVSLIKSKLLRNVCTAKLCHVYMYALYVLHVIVIRCLLGLYLIYKHDA